VAESYEHGNEPSDSMEGKARFGYRIFKKESTQWSYFTATLILVHIEFYKMQNCSKVRKRLLKTWQHCNDTYKVEDGSTGQVTC
jgi:hypothetical protein